MAAPSLTLGTPGTQDTATTSFSVDLPAGTSNKLIFFTYYGGGADITVSATSWNLLSDNERGTGYGLAILYRESTSETSVTVSTSANVDAVWVGASTDGDVTAITSGTPALETTGTPNPPSVTVSSGDYRVIALCIYDDARRSVTAYPTGYTDTQSNPKLDGNDEPGMGIASNGQTGITSADPDTFTIAGSGHLTLAHTIAVPEAAGGTPGSVTPAVLSAALTIPGVSTANTDGTTVSVAATSTAIVVPAVSLVGGGVATPPATALSAVFPAAAGNDLNPGGLPDAAVIAFYDAREIAGSPTDPVTSWADSGPLSQDPLAEATNAPVISDSGFGGVRSVQFDGSNDELNVTLDQSYTGDFAIIIAIELLTYPTGTAAVAYSTGSIPNKNILGVDDVEDPPGWVVMSGENGTQAEHHHGTNNQTYLEATPSRFVMTQLVENDNRLRLWENSVLVIDEAPASTSGTLNNMGALKLGAREDSTRFMNCRIGAVLLVDYADTDLTTVLAAATELEEIFGVTTSSPATTTPAVTSAALTIPAASPAGAGSVSPAVLARSFLVNQVTVKGGGVGDPAATALAAVFPAVSLSGGGVTAPGALAASMTIPAVNALGGTTVEPATSVLALTVPAASPAGAGAVSPAQIGLAFTIPQVALAGGGVATPGEIGLTFTVPSVNTVTGGAGSVTPAQIATAAVLDAVTVQGGGVVTVSDVTAVLTIPNTTVSGSASATPDVIGLAATVPQVATAGGGVVSPDATSVSYVIPGVTVSGAAVGAPDAVELTVTIPTASTANSDAGADSHEGELSLTFQEGGLTVSVQGSGLSVVEQSSGLEVSQ